MKVSKEALRAEEKLNAAYRAVLRTDEGRLVLRDILALSGLLAPSCQPNGNGGFTSGSETFWREGRRSIGLALKNRLDGITAYAYAGLVEESAREIENERVKHQPARRSEESDE